MNDDLKLPFFDPDFCQKVAQSASAACILWFLLELGVLAFVTPDPSRCAGWVIHQGEPSQTHVGLLIAMFTALPTAWICFNTFRWRRSAEKIYNAILAYPQYIINHNLLWLCVCVGWALFSSAPLWIMLSNCTSALQSLGF